MTTILLPSILLLTLALYIFVASQPLFCGMALGAATERLSAPAFIELRQHIDAAMQKPLRWGYYDTLAVNAALVIGAALAFIALAFDIYTSLKGNVPINIQINGWTPAQYPADWQSYRSRWMAIYRRRQGALTLGLAALLAGAVIGG